MKIIIAFFLAFSIKAFPQDCSPTNLLTEPDSPFKSMPVLDHDGSGICYAYVASQMVNYHLLSKGRGRDVHPVWAAIVYAEERNRRGLDSGDPYLTTLYLKEKGNCSETLINMSLTEWVNKAKVPEDVLISFIEMYAMKMESEYETLGLGDGSHNLSANEKAFEAAKKIIGPHCPQHSLEALMPELKKLSLLSSRKLFTSLILPECRSRARKLNFPAPILKKVTSDEDGISYLQRSLNTLKAPVAVQLCANFLHDPSYRGVTVRNSVGLPSALDCQNHAVMAVGKKQIANKCHFLIRNSWGSGWGKWAENLSCMCKNRSTGQLVDDCNIKTHNNGQFTVEACWVDSGPFSRNFFRAFTIGK